MLDYPVNRRRPANAPAFADNRSEGRKEVGLIDRMGVFLLLVAVWWFGGATEASRLAIDLGCLVWGGVVLAVEFRKNVFEKWIPIGTLLLAFVCYGTVSTLNPAFRLVEQGDLWWVEGLEPVAWLPAGFAPNWSAALGWPPLLHTVSVTFFGLALAQRVSSAARVRFFLVSCTWNAALLGVVGILILLSGTRRLLGLYEVQFEYFFGPIVYKNHAVALLTLLCGIATMEWLRASRCAPDRRSGWSLAAGLAAGVAWSSLILTRSAFGLFAATCLAILAGVMIWADRGKLRLRVIALACLLTAGGALAVGWGSLEAKATEWREGKASNSVGLRVEAIQAGVRMWLDRPWNGWGPGAFQYGFSHYKRQVPSLDQNRHLQLHWRHLHCDPLELLIEWGVVGTLPLAVALGLLVVRLVQGRSSLADPHLMVKAALVLVVLHSLIDFPFRNPAVALHAVVALALLLHAGHTAQPSNSTKS